MTSCPECGVNYSMARSFVQDGDSDETGKGVIGAVLGGIPGPAGDVWDLLPGESKSKNIKKYNRARKRAAEIRDPEALRWVRQRKNMDRLDRIALFSIIIGILSCVTCCFLIGTVSGIMGIYVLKKRPNHAKARSIRTKAIAGIVASCLSFVIFFTFMGV